MNIKDLNLKKINKDEIINAVMQNNFEKLTNNEKGEVQKNIKSALLSSDYILALNYLIIGIAFDPEITFDNIRKRGLFRYSNFVKKKCIIDSIVVELIELVQKINYKSTKNINYLNSILELKIIYKVLKELNLLINKEIIYFEKKYKNKSLVKTLLAYNDFLFLKNHVPDQHKITTKPSSRSKENISSAVSLIVFKISELRNLKAKDSYPISEEFILNDNIDKLIGYAISVIDLKEFEILIDSFNYQCQRNNKTIKIFHENPNFQKSIDLGYIRWQVQVFNDAFRVGNEIDKNILSLERFVEDLYKYENFDFFEYTEDGEYPRYRIVVPEPAIDYIFDKFIAPELLFREEIQYLSKVYKEQLINFDDLKSTNIKDNFSLYDFVRINRVFSLFYLLFAKKIFEVEKENPILIVKSLIPSFAEDQLYFIFSKIFTVEQLDDYLDLVCWDDGLDVLFDIQYHPIIYIEKTFLISLSVLANSNLLRNVYASEYKRNNKYLFSNGEVDPLVDLLAVFLQKSNVIPYKNSIITNGEIDLFYVIDDTLFVIECKQSLHPTSIHDLRTTYDYIVKAEKQIDNIKNLFLTNNLLGQLENIHKISLSSITKIEPCIVLSNRLFNGNVFKYPIRNHNEFVNLIIAGTIATKEGVFKIWKGDEISKDDFTDYFSIDNKFYQELYKELKLINLKYDFLDSAIELDSYSMNVNDAEEAIRYITKDLPLIEKAYIE